MATHIRIAPSILAADFARLGEQVQQAEAAGADWIHVDVMDGRFVPNITMGPVVLEAVRRSTSLPLDVHLMIVEPERYVDAFAKAGATRINVHWEVSPNLHRTLQTIRELGCATGLAINPHTPAAFISEVILVLAGSRGIRGQLAGCRSEEAVELSKGLGIAARLQGVLLDQSERSPVVLGGDGRTNRTATGDPTLGLARRDTLRDLLF